MPDQSVSAIVAYAPQEGGMPNFRHETITLTRTEPGPMEVLVRMLAVGICHSDIVAGSVPDGALGMFPKVLGHEGSGYVEAIGSEVKSVKPGDPVLLSYTYCGTCELCTNDIPTYCQNFVRDNVACVDRAYNAKDGVKVGGKFFGQSSFASLSMVDEQSIVNVQGLVSGDEELRKYSPLGCGLMTGSGSVVNTAQAKPTDAIVVAGLGAVGMGAIMAAKIRGCRGIIAIDRIESRLEMAKQLGATHTFNTSALDITKDSYASNLAEQVRTLTSDGKINYAIDTTGVSPVIYGLIKTLSKRGRFIQIGVPIPVPTAISQLDFQDFFYGSKRMEVNCLGDALAKNYVPKMIQWHKDGKFPFDKFIKFYAAKDFAQALEDMKTEVIKPILVH